MKIDEILNESWLDNLIARVFKQKKPSLSADQLAAVKSYTGAGYRDINHYLRTTSGEKYGEGDHPRKPYDISSVDQKINLLSSAFTPESTNKNTIITFSGVSPNTFRRITQNENGIQTFSKFTSTSLELNVALNFAELYADASGELKKDHTLYVLECICPPETALILDNISANKYESEALLNHGTKFKIVKIKETTERDLKILICTVEIIPPR